MTEVILVYEGTPGPPGPAGPPGTSTPSLTVRKAASETVVSNVSEIVLGNNLTLNEGDDGEAEIAALGGGSGGGSYGSDFGLTFNGVTDQTKAAQDALQALPAGSTARFLSPLGGTLRLNGRLVIPSEMTADFSQIDIDLGANGEIWGQGEFVELPASNLFRLRVDAAPDADTLQVDISPQGSMALLTVGTRCIIRGQNDGAGNALQRHEFTITARSTVPGAETITIDPPLPDDEGTFEVDYPAGDYQAAFGVVDRTLISVKVGQLLTVNCAKGADSVTVADGSVFVAGDIVQLFDDYLGKDIGGDSNNSIRDMIVRVRLVTGNTVFFDEGVSRDFTTARSAILFKINSSRNVVIIAARRTRLVEAPIAAPGPRKHYYVLAYCVQSHLKGIVNDEFGHSFSHRGQAGRLFHSLECTISYSRRARPNGAGSSGDLYGFADYYGNRNKLLHCYTERCRHGQMAHGSTNTEIAHFQSVDDLINAVDAHGAWSTGLSIHDGKIQLGRDFAPDASQKAGITLGNTSHYGGDHDVTIRDIEINAPPGLAGTRGIIVRAGCTGVELTKSVRVNGAEVAVDISRTSTQPDLTTEDVDLGGLIAQGCGTFVKLNGAAPAWASGTPYTGTATRPAYVENASKVYRTTTGGTSGATAPTHTSGSVSDGGVTWAFVTSSLYYPLKDIRLDGAKSRGCNAQIEVTRVDGLEVLDARVREPAAPLTFPAINAIEVLRLVCRYSELSATQGGIKALRCPGARIAESAFYDMAGGVHWFVDLGGNDGTFLVDNKTFGTTAGIDTSGGSTLTIIGPGQAGVSTFNGRAGAVVAQAGDYTAAQITETSAAKIMTLAERTKLAALFGVPDPSGGTDGHVPTISSGAYALAAPPGGGGGGSINGATNVGTGAGVFKDVLGASIRLKSILSSTTALTVTGNADDIALALANATTSAAGLMSSTDKSKLDGLGTTGVNSFNARTGAVLPASGDYTADQVSDTVAKVLMTVAERSKLAALDTARQLATGGSTGQFAQKTAGGVGWGDAVSFPVRTDAGANRLVIGPSNYATDLAAFLTACATIYANPGGYALQLVTTGINDDFLRLINQQRDTVIRFLSDGSDRPVMELLTADGTNVRFRLTQDGLVVGPDASAVTLAAGQVARFRGNIEIDGSILAGPTAGGDFATPLVIGAVRLWDDGTKLRAKRGSDPTNNTDGSVLW